MNFKTNLLQEYTEIQIRLIKLRDSTYTDIFRQMDNEEKREIEHQIQVMFDYQNILAQRVFRHFGNRN